MSRPKYESFSKEQMQDFISHSSSFEEVLIKMEYTNPRDSRFITSVRNYCNRLGIDNEFLPNIINSNTIICKQCGREKAITEFYTTRRVCKECVCKNEQEKYGKTKEKIIKYKEEHPCQKCGCNKHYLIDFHHIDPKQKDYTISTNTHAKFETLLKEIEKCISLCSNCHREFHYLEREQGITIQQYLNGVVE